MTEIEIVLKEQAGRRIAECTLYGMPSRYFVLDSAFECIDASADGKKVLLEHTGEKIDIRTETGILKGKIYCLKTAAACVCVRYAFPQNFSKSGLYAHVDTRQISLDPWYITFFPSPVMLTGARQEGQWEKVALKFKPMRIEDLTRFAFFEQKMNAGVRELYFSHQTPYKLLGYDQAEIEICGDGPVRAMSLFSDRKALPATVEATEKIFSFYNNRLFCALPRVQPFTLYSMGYPKLSNAFVRHSLIQFDRFPSPLRPVDKKLILPHEIAHLWCMSDDFAIQAQILAEGGAQWSSLFFAYSKMGERLFARARRQLDKQSKRYLQKKKAADAAGKPIYFSAHAIGFALFDAVYQTFGLEKTMDCVRHFAYSKHRNYAEFLEAVKKNERAEIYRLVYENLTPYIKEK